MASSASHGNWSKLPKGSDAAVETEPRARLPARRRCEERNLVPARDPDPSQLQEPANPAVDPQMWQRDRDSKSTGHMRAEFTFASPTPVH